MLSFEQKLQTLAGYFPVDAPLFSVGGFVRDKLLGTNSYDVDVCSQLDVYTVKTLLSNSDFAVSDKNLRMGTVIISSGDFKVEYTAFRTDSYDRTRGDHSPKEVEFTNDISLDARRRDFACNAIYQNVLTGEIVDFVGGVQDVKNRILKTADEPERVFEADGLRVLRLVRFASELGFEIDEKTLAVAKANAWRVKDIAVERIRDELNKIFVADTKHPSLNVKNGHLVGLRLLDELGLLDMLLPEVTDLKGLEQPRKYHLYDAFEHTVKAFEVAPPNLRWVALLHDIGKIVCMREHGNMHGHDEEGARMARDICERLKFSNAETVRICGIIRWHMVDIHGDMSIDKLRLFAVEHIDVADDVCAFKRIDSEASCGEPHDSRLKSALDEVRADGTPLNVKELKVDGNDLILLGVPSYERAGLLKELLRDTVLNPRLNDRDKALAYIAKKAEDKKGNKNKKDIKK